MRNKQDRGKQRLYAIKILNHSCTIEWASLMAWQCRRRKKRGFNPLLRRSPGVKVKSLSRVWLFATLWTVGHQAPLSMGFPRQEYWSGFPFPSPGDLPDPGIEHRSPALQADALGSGNLLPYSCLENPMDRGTWQTTVHGVIKSQIRLSDSHTHKLKQIL